MDLGKGRISGRSFAEMITAVTHPHQHGGKANSSFAAPAVNLNESLFFCCTKRKLEGLPLTPSKHY